MKRDPTSLIIREALIETTMRYHPHLSEWLSSKRQKINVGNDVENRKPLYTVGGNVAWYSHDGKRYTVSSKN